MAELYLETPTSVGIRYLAGILEDRCEYVDAIEAAWAEAREAALRCLRENVMLEVGYHARLPSGRSVGVFTPGRLYLTAVSHPQANWKGEWQGDVARLHDHIYIGPEGIAEQTASTGRSICTTSAPNCRPSSRPPTRRPWSSPCEPSLNLQWRTPEDGTTEVLGVAPGLLAEYPRLICHTPG